MKLLQTTLDDLVHLFFPHICAGCGTDALGQSVLCVECLHRLPVTNFHEYLANPVEKMFRGRLPVRAASSLLYFSKDSLVQRLLHQLKYRGNKPLGYTLGHMMGAVLKTAPLFSEVNLLVPLPLHIQKERKRGYNQAALMCDGLSEATGIPVCKEAVHKETYTETQTHKNRIQRWQNIKGRFALSDPGPLKQKHVLLVDDVVTTGATLEACGCELLQGGVATLRIATLAYAVK